MRVPSRLHRCRQSQLLSVLLLAASLPALIVSPAKCSIVSGTTLVQYNRTLVFYPSAVNNISGSAHAPYGYVYNCSPASSGFDIVVPEEGLYTCAWICHDLAIQAARPFFISKNEFSADYSFITSNVLNVNDKNRFTRQDTVRDSTGCYLPFIKSSQGYKPQLFTEDSSKYAVFKNNNGQYILARLTPVMGIDSEPNFGTNPLTWNAYPYVAGYTVKWYLQTDGTTDFRTITSVLPGRQPIQAKAGSQGSEYFSIRGQRIISLNHSALGVVLERNGNSFRKIVVQPRLRR